MADEPAKRTVGRPPGQEGKGGRPEKKSKLPPEEVKKNRYVYCSEREWRLAKARIEEDRKERAAAQE